MRPCFPPTWTSLCGGNVMEVQLPQLWQVCVGTLLSGTPFRIPRCTICWSTSPTVFVFVFSTGFFYKPPTLEKLSPGTYSMAIFESRDTSQGRWEWPVAVVWLPDFVARLVRQVRLIPVSLHIVSQARLSRESLACETTLHSGGMKLQWSSPRYIFYVRFP